MMFKKIAWSTLRALGLLAACLIAQSASAEVATYSVGNLPQAQPYTFSAGRNGSFEDAFDFSLTTTADLVAAVSVLNMDLGNVPILQISNPVLSLYGAASPNPIATAPLNLSLPGLGVGDYVVKFAGIADGLSGGNYVLGIYSAVAMPIPEPGQWAMFLVGLAAVLVVFRKKSPTSYTEADT